MKELKIKSGAYIYMEDTKDNNIYFIKEGKVKLRRKEIKYLYHGELSEVKYIGNGAVFGYEELFLHETRTERAVAVTDCSIIIFKFNEFFNTLEKNKNIGKKIIYSLSERIRSLNDKIFSLTDEKKEESNIKEICKYFIERGEKENSEIVLAEIEKIQNLINSK